MPMQLHHAGQMPGSGIHEVDPMTHNQRGVHGQKTQGVTDEMRQADRELYWQMRGQEMGNPPPPSK
jgi:hypothetical protein